MMSQEMHGIFIAVRSPGYLSAGEGHCLWYTYSVCTYAMKTELLPLGLTEASPTGLCSRSWGSSEVPLHKMAVSRLCIDF